MFSAESVDYSLWTDLTWDDLQSDLPVAEYDATILTRLHPNELASKRFLEYAREHPLRGVNLISPDDFLSPEEHIGDDRYIRGGNLNMAFPTLEEYAENPDAQGTTPLHELAWNIRRVLSNTFVGVDVHGGPANTEDYVLLNPDANFAARALARYLVGDAGKLVESTKGTAADSTVNTVTYELCLSDFDSDKVYRLYERLRTASEEGMVNFLGAMDPNAGARYDFRAGGQIDYPSARAINVFWDRHIAAWRVIDPRLVRVGEDNARQAPDGSVVSSLSELDLPQNSPLPEGCEDIVGLVWNPDNRSNSPLLINGCVPGGTRPDPSLGFGWYTELVEKSRVDHTIRK